MLVPKILKTKSVGTLPPGVHERSGLPDILLVELVELALDFWAEEEQGQALCQGGSGTKGEKLVGDVKPKGYGESILALIEDPAEESGDEVVGE